VAMQPPSVMSASSAFLTALQVPQKSTDDLSSLSWPWTSLSWPHCQLHINTLLYPSILPWKMQRLRTFEMHWLQM
ncbi:hypothetical protein HispidOSU_020522, partial [Sigmodon hispidus]